VLSNFRSMNLLPYGRLVVCAVTLTIGWFSVVFGTIDARADDAHFHTLSTTDGNTYTNVTVKRSDPSGIDIVYDAGAVHIPFEKLSAEIQKQYGYDPIKAADFVKQKAAAQVQADAELAIALQQQADADKSMAKAKQSLMDAKSSPARIFGNVLQKCEGGYLVSSRGSIFYAPVTTSLGAMGGGGGASGGYTNADNKRPPLLPAGVVIFLFTSKDMVDDDRVDVDIYPIGEYSYIDVQGAQRTVRRYTDNLDSVATPSQ